MMIGRKQLNSLFIVVLIIDSTLTLQQQQSAVGISAFTTFRRPAHNNHRSPTTTTTTTTITTQSTIRKYSSSYLTREEQSTQHLLRQHQEQRRYPTFLRLQKQQEQNNNDNQGILHKVNNSNNNNNKIGFYIHIPYCRKRCRYCDFAIIPIGNKIQTNGGGDTVTPSASASATPTPTPTAAAAAAAAATTTASASLSSTSTSIHDEHLINQRQRNGFEKLNANYTNAIVNEIDVLIDSIIQQQQQIQQHDEDYSDQTKNSIHLDSIYFGGGTPSLAPLDTIQLILHHILDTKKSIFTTTDETEITMEMDPGTFTLQQLYSLKEMGINRISLGVQSFNDTILDSIGRIHSSQDIYNSISMISQVYGSDDDDHDNVNYSIDLISGLPGLDCASWVETLQHAMELKPQPTHLSIYDLQIESGTVFGNWYEDHVLSIDDDDQNENDKEKEAKQNSKNQSTLKTKLPEFNGRNSKDNPLPLPSSADCAFMYQFASGYLRSKGYEHYEISSYAKKPSLLSSSRQNRDSNKKSYRSQHNQIYWEIGSDWYAVGLGATSCVDKRRYARPRSMSDYIVWTKMLKKNMNDNASSTSAKKLPVWTDEEESWEHDLEDVIMTRLRTKDGLNLNWILEQDNGQSIYDNILQGSKLGFDLDLIRIEKSGPGNDDDVLRLNDPKGFLYSNSIISSIFAELF